MTIIAGALALDGSGAVLAVDSMTMKLGPDGRATGAELSADGKRGHAQDFAFVLRGSWARPVVPDPTGDFLDDARAVWHAYKAQAPSVRLEVLAATRKRMMLITDDGETRVEPGRVIVCPQEIEYGGVAPLTLAETQRAVVNLMRQSIHDWQQGRTLTDWIRGGELPAVAEPVNVYSIQEEVFPWRVPA